jgi:amino acid transporter
MVMAMLSGHMLYSTFSNVHIGEMKGANILRNQLIQMLGALFLMCGIFFAVILYLVPVSFGAEFWGSLNYLNMIGKQVGQPGYSVFYAFMAAVDAGPQGYQILGFIFLVGLILQNVLYYQLANIYNGVKYLFAAAFDGLLPKGLAYIHPRTRAPIVALVILMVMGLIWYTATIAVGNPNVIFSLFAVFLFGALIYYGGTSVAAALFPYSKRTKAIYEASPIKKYKIGNIPLVTITGTLGALYCLFLIIVYLTTPELGAITIPSTILTVVIYIAMIALYFVARGIRKSQGIDTDAAYRELPPD